VTLSATIRSNENAGLAGVFFASFHAVPTLFGTRSPTGCGRINRLFIAA
jgi:hypothetical protein